MVYGCQLYNCAILRAADLLDAIPPETLAALKAGTWQAVPVEPTEAMNSAMARSIGSTMGIDNFGERANQAHHAMLAASPRKPES